MSAPLRVHEAFCLDFAQQQFLFKDDFLGDQLRDEWRTTGGAGGSGAVVDGETGGIVRITTDGDEDDNWFLDWNDIRSLLVTKRVTMEVRLKANQVTYCGPVMSLFFDVSNFIRIYFNETGGTADNWTIECVDGGATTSADSGILSDTDYHLFRIECHIHGSSHVHFYIDDVECANSPISTNVPDDAADYLQPNLLLVTREDAIKSMDVDYVVIRQDR